MLFPDINSPATHSTYCTDTDSYRHTCKLSLSGINLGRMGKDKQRLNKESNDKKTNDGKTKDDKGKELAQRKPASASTAQSSAAASASLPAARATTHEHSPGHVVSLMNALNIPDSVKSQGQSEHRTREEIVSSMR